jgi:hypothetical protein
MPIHTRHIGDKYRYPLIPSQSIESFLAAFGADHFAAQVLQHTRDCFEYAGVIIHNQHSAAHSKTIPFRQVNAHAFWQFHVDGYEGARADSTIA